MTALDVDVTVERPGHTTSVAFRMRAGERLALLGPNGAGKTTVLEAIAGLQHPSAGQIRIGDLVLDGPGRHLRPDQRGVTILNQSTRLFPHLSALRNVEFGPRMQGRSVADAREWLDRFGLADRARAMPHELSGGQQQKVAIARAFAAEPQVLLLDEPFDALDATSTHDTRRMLTEALTDQGTTSILVTHDLADAWQWASRCLIVERGRIAADTTTAELVSAPDRPFTAALAGFGVLRGAWGEGVVDVGGVVVPAASSARLASGAAVVAIADPRAVEIAEPGGAGALPGTVDAAALTGGVVSVHHSSGLIVHWPRDTPPVAGTQLWVRPTALRAYPDR